MSSFTSFTGKLGLQVRMRGAIATSEIGSKLFTGSKLSLPA
jgi:hypothetical protein